MLKSRKLFFLTCLLAIYTFNNQLNAQHHVGRYEYLWAIFHPVAAFKIKAQLPKVMEIYKEVKQQGVLDNYESGGKLDAFRHTYVMAYLARKVKPKKLLKLGMAHEKDNKIQFFKKQLEQGERPDSLACEMDLRNNKLGVKLGLACSDCSDDSLKQYVLKHINDGNAWYLKRNNLGQYVDCDGNVIDNEQFKSVWALPKCLILTNQ